MKQDIETWRIEKKSDINKEFQNKTDEEINGTEVKSWNERVDNCHKVLDGINHYYKPGESLKESLQNIKEMNDDYIKYSLYSNEILQNSVQVIEKRIDYCEKDALIPDKILKKQHGRYKKIT